MPLSGLHTIGDGFDRTEYFDFRNLAIKRSENFELFRQRLRISEVRPQYDDPAAKKGNLFIGYGLDLRVNSVAKINDWYNRAGLTLSENDKDLLIVYQSNPSSTNAEALRKGFTPLPGESAATQLLNVALEDFEAQFATKFGTMADSRERAGLVSIVYNRGIDNPRLQPLIDAIQSDNRALAWFEIRYRSNAQVGTSFEKGLAARRYRESDDFGLYSNDPLSPAEARNIVAVLGATDHAKFIRDYEGRNSPGDGNRIKEVMLPALQELFASFGLNQPLEEAAVRGSSDIGGDPLQGTSKNDLLLGAAGHDILIGGAGNDVLRGEEGKDLYVYNSGDGQDVIVDNAAQGGDGLGAITFDNLLLAGGIKKAGETVYTSLDGQFTFVQSGPDLLVNGALTVKNFTNGQFGIQLVDEVSYTGRKGS